MIKRWLTQIGNCEFIHKTPKDALSYGDEKIQVTEMISIDLYEKYVEALEQEKESGNVYMQAYRAGWNDALDQIKREIPDVFSYADLKSATEHFAAICQCVPVDQELDPNQK